MVLVTKASRRSKTLRAVTPPPFPTMSVSEFVRGGLYGLDQPTTIMSHSEVLGAWYPDGQGMSATYYASSSTPTADLTNLVLGSVSARSSPPIQKDTVAKAIEVMQLFLAQAEETEDK